MRRSRGLISGDPDILAHESVPLRLEYGRGLGETRSGVGEIHGYKEHLKSLRCEIQRVDKAELALAEGRKAILDHNPKNKRPTAMPIDTSKNL
jgi:hypothetical protein